MKEMIMKKSRLNIIICLVFCAAGLAASRSGRSAPAEDGVMNVRACGAAGDGKALDTVAIQKAIDSVTSGGGTVLLPPGTYRSGTLRLKSGVTLRLAKGATLLGSTDIFDYQKREGQGDPQVFSKRGYEALLRAEGVHDITVCGEGTIDGQGAALAKDVDRKSPVKFEKRPPENFRPKLIDFSHCANAAVRGVTLRNSACWVQNYEACDGLDLSDLTVDSVAFWNNDGFDVNGSRNVRIINCRVNAADDGICLKSSETPCENVTIANCIVRSSASALKFGTGSSQGFKNVVVNNLAIYDTARSGIALEIVDGGMLENVAISNVTMRNVGNAIFIRLGDRARRTRPEPTVGTLRDVTISNVVATVTGDSSDAGYPLPAPRNKEPHNLIPCSITGVPGHPVQRVTLSNINLILAGGADPTRAHVELDALNKIPERANRYPEYDQFGELPAWGFYCRHVEGLSLSQVTMRVAKPDFRPALVCDDVKDLALDAFTPRVAGQEPLLVLNNVRGAQLRGCVAPRGTNIFLRMQHGCSDVAVQACDLRYARLLFDCDPETPLQALAELGNIKQ